MDYFLSDTLALQVIRTARRGEGISTVRTDDQRVLPIRKSEEPRHWADLGQATIKGVPCLNDFDETHRLKILVPSADKRPARRTIKATVCSRVFPAGTFSQVIPSEGLTSGRILVPSPELICAQLAALLQQSFKQAPERRHLAVVRMVELLDELLGTYSRDPMSPRVEPVAFGLERICTKDEFSKALEQLGPIPGSPLLKQALALSVENSSSPMETLHHIMSSLPPRFGGISLIEPEMNKPLEFTPHEQGIVSHVKLSPDLSFEACKTHIEHNGEEWHQVPKARKEDAYRIQDYQVCGRAVFPAVFNNVRSQSAFNEFAAKICDSFDRNGKPGTLARFRRLKRDDEFRLRQATTLAHLLPPVTRYD